MDVRDGGESHPGLCSRESVCENSFLELDHSEPLRF